LSSSIDRESGFSLIEILAAMALLAVSLSAFYPAFSNAAFGLKRSEDRLLASVFARSLMEQTTSSRRLLPGRVSGTDGPFRWTLTTALREGPDEPAPDGASTPAVAQPGQNAAPPSPQQSTWQLYDLALDVTWGTPPRTLRLQTVHLAREATR
jgi:general secretion pathway protein I